MYFDQLFWCLRIQKLVEIILLSVLVQFSEWGKVTHTNNSRKFFYPEELLKKILLDLFFIN